MHRVLRAAKRLFALMVCGCMLTVFAPAHASRLVELKENVLTDAEWQSLREHLQATEHGGQFLVEGILWRGYAKTWSEALQYIREGLHSGHADVNGDGQDEVLVVFTFGDSCGSIGCEAVIFELRHDRWEYATSFWGGTRGEICTAEGLGNGYPVVYSDFDSVWWTGEAFAGACIWKCGEEDEANPPGADALAMRRKLEAEPPCWTFLGN